MKYGELKIECMAVMDEMNEPITMDTLENFEGDESYKDLFARMPGAINRAMDRMANRQKLPIKEYKLTNPEKKGGYFVFDLSKLKDFRSAKRIEFVNNNTYLDEIEFIQEGKKIRTFAGYNGDLTLYYYPTAPAIDRAMDNEAEVEIPDELARIIPYYVKSDLMTRDEPGLATQARNKFEEALDEINLNDDGFGETIKKDYRIE